MSKALIKAWEGGAKDYRVNNSPFYKKLKQTDPEVLDTTFKHLHEKAFDKMDCLECANCCKTTSPIFYPADISRLATILKMNEMDFVASYLKKDQDQDYVLKKAPCPFLGNDNKCTVYEDRPTACREFPSTDRKNMQQIINLTFNNAEICPAVYEIMEKLKAVKS